MKLFKRMITLVLSMSLIFLLIGGFSLVASAEKVKLEYYVLANRGEMEAEKIVVNLFEQIYPNIDIEIVWPSTGEYYDKLRALIAADMIPDLMRIVVEQYQSLAEGGALLDLLPLIEKERKENPYFATQWEDFLPELVEPFYHKGGFYGLPRGWNDATIFYNKRLFDEAGLAYPNRDWTVDDFIGIAKTLTKDIDGDGTMDQYGYLLTGDWFDSILPWVYTFGGKILDDTWKKCVATEPESIAGIQFMADLVRKYKVSPAPELVAADASFSGLRGWMTSRVGMAHYGRYMTPAFRKIEDFDWDCQHQPSGPQGIRGVTYGVGYQCLSSTTKHPKEAFQFATFMSGPVAQKVFDEAGNSIQVLKSIIFTEDYLHPKLAPRNQGVMVEALAFARLIPSPPRNHEITRIATSEIEKVLLGLKSAEDAAREMHKQITVVLEETR